MSGNTTPEFYNELEDAFMSDATFKVDISEKMKVPNRISFNGESNNGVSFWNSSEALNMQVPERILVAGQHQHFGTKAPPREIVYDNSILPKDPYQTEIRVATPPRNLTLDKYPFPGVNNDSNEEQDDEEQENISDRIPVVKAKTKFDLNETLNDSCISLRESTPPIGYGEKLTPAEEVYHLRRQMAKLNRRIMALELENLNRLQREKILYGMGIAYFLLKAIIWLNRY